MNQYTGAPEGGMAEGWIKGMEMCSHMLAWGMLQPDQGGAQVVEVGRLIAYYEALPNEAGRRARALRRRRLAHPDRGRLDTEGLQYTGTSATAPRGAARTPTTATPRTACTCPS